MNRRVVYTTLFLVLTFVMLSCSSSYIKSTRYLSYVKIPTLRQSPIPTQVVVSTSIQEATATATNKVIFETTPPSPTQTSTPVITPTSTSTPVFEKCPENGDGTICFGDYYKELPASSHKNVLITPLYIIIHTDDQSGHTPKRWFSYITWNGLSNREDGGRASHFGVGLDGIGQFLPMYQDIVMQSWAASPNMDKKSINIEMCGRDYNNFITGKADQDTKSSIMSITEKTVDLVKRLMEQYNIPIENVLGHYQVYEGKSDPGDRYLQEYFIPLLKGALDNN